MPNDCHLSYEHMWEIIFALADGYAQKTLARKYSVSKNHIAAIAKEYNVGRRQGQTRRSVQKETKLINKLVEAGTDPKVARRARGNHRLFGFKVKRSLLTQDEKAVILAAIKAGHHEYVSGYAFEFKRLPATIRKIAEEAGIILR